jgi:hypothetical protein
VGQTRKTPWLGQKACACGDTNVGSAPNCGLAPRHRGDKLFTVNKAKGCRGRVLLGLRSGPRPNSRVTKGHFAQRPLKMVVAEHVAMILTFTTDFRDTENAGIPSSRPVSQNS